MYGEKIWRNEGDFQLRLRANVQENQVISPLGLHQLEMLRGAKYGGRAAPC